MRCLGANAIPESSMIQAKSKSRSEPALPPFPCPWPPSGLPYADALQKGKEKRYRPNGVSMWYTLPAKYPNVSPSGTPPKIIPDKKREYKDKILPNCGQTFYNAVLRCMPFFWYNKQWNK